MPTIPPTVKLVVHYLIVLLAFVAALTPAVATLAGVLPSPALHTLTSVVAGAGVAYAALTNPPAWMAPILAQLGIGLTAAVAKSAVKALQALSVLCLVGTLGALGLGCGWFKSNSTAIVTDIGGVAACVISHVETDPDPTFEGIASECAGAAVADVVSIVTALSTVSTTATDGGVMTKATHPRAALVHHRGGGK